MKKVVRWLWIPLLGVMVAVPLYLRWAAAPRTDGGTTSRQPAPGPPLEEMTPETYARMAPLAAEYFHFRKQAVLAGNVQVLWDRYPALKEGADPGKGINAEARAVEGLRSLKPIDGNFSLESYERMKFRIMKTGEVFVHGTETFLYRNQDGSTGESGGEILISLHFMPGREEGYTLVKTDEVTLAEVHEQKGW